MCGGGDHDEWTAVSREVTGRVVGTQAVLSQGLVEGCYDSVSSTLSGHSGALRPAVKRRKSCMLPPSHANI